MGGSDIGVEESEYEFACWNEVLKGVGAPCGDELSGAVCSKPNTDMN